MEPKDDNISRTEAIRSFSDIETYGDPLVFNAMNKAIKKLEKLEGKEPKRKQGHWIYRERRRGGIRRYRGKTKGGEDVTVSVDERYTSEDPYCSECGCLGSEVSLNFCPKCGAEMTLPPEKQKKRFFRKKGKKNAKELPDEA